jgi:imidazole glycerol-phosphate synthase subunit HisF
VLKVRVMPTLLYKDLGLVKGVGFDSWRRVGGLMQAIKVYNMRGVDELVFLDITATRERRRPDFELVDDFADECFMPLAVGGGIASVDDVRELLRVGADKVVVNSAAFEHPDLITEVSQRFGSQCIVVSIDFRTHPDSTREVFTESGARATGRDPVDFAVDAERLGAGEILLTSVEKDGAMKGYDIATTREVVTSVGIPVIASGGCGSYRDMHQAILEAGASAVAAASIFHFTQATPLEAKRCLSEHGIDVRA